MKFKYIGDPLDKTPEGINTGPLYTNQYGYEFKKDETIVDIPDDAVIKDKSGQPSKPITLICSKLLYNRHFVLVSEPEPKQVDFEEVTEQAPKKRGRPRKKVNEPSTIESTSESITAA